MKTFIFKDSQFNAPASDAPDNQIILDALSDIYNELHIQKDNWMAKGNYNFLFWRDLTDNKTIYCNAFIFSNPDDFDDHKTDSQGYYYELEEV